VRRSDVKQTGVDTPRGLRGVDESLWEHVGWQNATGAKVKLQFTLLKARVASHHEHAVCVAVIQSLKVEPGAVLHDDTTGLQPPKVRGRVLVTAAYVPVREEGESAGSGLGEGVNLREKRVEAVHLVSWEDKCNNELVHSRVLEHEGDVVRV
jgi:hypothetical protein